MLQYDIINDVNNSSCLTIVFTNKRQKAIFANMWEEIEDLINKADNNVLLRDDDIKDFTLINYDTDGSLEFNSTVDIDVIKKAINFFKNYKHARI